MTEGTGNLALRGDIKGSANPETSVKRAKTETSAGVRAKQTGGDKAGDKGDVGKSLRTVYQQTVNEDVPDELLDLLGKLS